MSKCNVVSVDHFTFFIPGLVVGRGGVVVGGGGVPEKNCRRKISRIDAFAELSVKRINFTFTKSGCRLSESLKV